MARFTVHYKDKETNNILKKLYSWNRNLNAR